MLALSSWFDGIEFCYLLRGYLLQLAVLVKGELWLTHWLLLMLLSKATRKHCWWLWSSISHVHGMRWWHHLAHIWWWKTSSSSHHLHLHLLLRCCSVGSSLWRLHLERRSCREICRIFNTRHLHRHLISIFFDAIHLLILWIHKIDLAQPRILKELCLRSIFALLKRSSLRILLRHHHVSSSLQRTSSCVLPESTSTSTSSSYSHHLGVKTFFCITIGDHATLFLTEGLVTLVTNLSSVLMTVS